MAVTSTLLNQLKELDNEAQRKRNREQQQKGDDGSREREQESVRREMEARIRGPDSQGSRAEQHSRQPAYRHGLEKPKSVLSVAQGIGLPNRKDRPRGRRAKRLQNQLAPLSMLGRLDADSTVVPAELEWARESVLRT